MSSTYSESRERDVSRDIMLYPGDRSCKFQKQKMSTFTYFLLSSWFPGSNTDSRMSVPSMMNNIRGIDRSMSPYDVPNKVNEDVFFDLIEMEKVAYGMPFTVTVQIQVTNLSERGNFLDYSNELIDFIRLARIVQRKCEPLQLFFRLPAFTTPVPQVVDWVALIASWSFNLDRVSPMPDFKPIFF